MTIDSQEPKKSLLPTQRSFIVSYIPNNDPEEEPFPNAETSDPLFKIIVSNYIKENINKPDSYFKTANPEIIKIIKQVQKETNIDIYLAIDKYYFPFNNITQKSQQVLSQLNEELSNILSNSQ